MITRTPDQKKILGANVLIDIQVQPTLAEGIGVLPVNDPDQQYTIDKLYWRFRYRDVGAPGAKRITQLVAPIITIENDKHSIIVDANQPQHFQGPQVVSGPLLCKIINPNFDINCAFDVKLYLWGRRFPVSDKFLLNKNYPCDCQSQTLMTRGCNDPNHY